MDTYSKMKAIAGERRSWALPRQRDHVFLILQVKEAFMNTHPEKGCSEVKMRRHHPIVGDVNLPIVLFTRARLGYEMRVRIGENREIHPTQTQSSAKQGDWSEGTWKKHPT